MVKPVTPEIPLASSISTFDVTQIGSAAEARDEGDLPWTR
jgi:hypothetical protein